MPERSLAWVESTPDGDVPVDLESVTELFDVLTALDDGFGRDRVEQYVRDHYDLHGPDGCDHDECWSDRDVAQMEAQEADVWRTIAQDLHDAMQAVGVQHGIGLFRHCPHELCRRAAELLGDR